ncbi:Asparagine synthetase [glutamine-hydrolyzing] [Sesamum angolense]|uniref:Asparagine synthetase [glutamine-hydrolyzing] n=1 Tax=Sesamum angolense TaxID=2727404 RepID=A0AAE1X9M3_9LAMI|nr:Asparagine synthetase [glutamine-hydrolyzing] [Sesamum angolense]
MTLRRRGLKHRGPDWSGLYQHGDCYLAHQRLAIVDPASGDQPLYNEDKKIVVTVNGEIYNHEELRRSLSNHKFYEEHGENFVDMLDGIFSFVLLDTRDNSFLVAVMPLGLLLCSVWISSELKGLHDECEHFESFPPGHLYSSKSGCLRRWYNPPWFSEAIPSTPYDPLVLRRAFENVRLWKLTLAGTKAAKHWGAQLHSFCVGLEGSPDLKAAREVADYLGTVHHEFHFTVQDGIDAIEDVIYHIETYDVTTIRASTPMFLMSRKIKSLGVKMVISGEGSDEIFGGYLYFHKAPNKEEFHRETCRKIKALHQYDCLRANKATSAWGLEARIPFLDKEFINVAMSIDPEWKMIKPEQKSIEKWILRRAFDDEKQPYLPKHILYRQKEQFSDGVGYSWIDGLKAHADLHNSARLSVPGGASVACSTATAVEWDAAWSKNLDPSGRAAIGVHNSAYEKHLVNGNLTSKIIDSIPLTNGVGTPGLAIRS